MVSKADNTDAICFEAVAELGKLLGLNKSASLALALLFTQAEPLSLDTIADQTNIAKSSTSVILKNLEHMGLVCTVDRPHDRRKFYQIADSLAAAFAALVARRLAPVTDRRSAIQAARRSPGHCPDDARLDELQAIYSSLEHVATLFDSQRAAAWGVIQDRLVTDAPFT
ncbi:MAG: MarR family transcriptional regulator [Anaerolineae bacterium]|nr:MarR family transcriptional regulator [Anaerolineae bacterium]